MAPKLKCHRIREEHDHTLLQRFERKHGGGGANKVKVEQLILSRFESASIRERARLDLTTDLPAYSDTVYSVTPLTVTLLAFPE